MTVFLFFLGLAQCVLLWGLGRLGQRLKAKAEKDRDMAKFTPAGGWPTCALIIPVGGEHPNMEGALRSLLEQDYPAYAVCLVTATNDDPAMSLINTLEDDYSNIVHVTAGRAEHCGQKNRNLLAGIARVGSAVDIYAFCDANHYAEPDFLRCLVSPIARGESAFATGYHEVEARDNSTITLSYALSVLFMRLLQGMAAFTQPWGGALAMTREAFERYRISTLWETNVVDDCSLAAWLRRDGVHVRLCPAALLRTPVSLHPLPVWRAWLERQILFLKFCLPGQWVMLGILSLAMLLPSLWCAWALLRGIVGVGDGMAPFLALLWLCLLAWVIGGWRSFLPRKAPPTRWLWAFFCASAMFAIVYAGTLWTRSIIWQNIVYHVGRNGVVTRIQRQ